MGKLRELVMKTEIKTSLRANTCRFNAAHKIPKGDLRFVVTPPAAVAREYSYCDRGDERPDASCSPTTREPRHAPVSGPCPVAAIGRAARLPNTDLAERFLAMAPRPTASSAGSTRI
jgi:hypothetical protein